MFNQYPGSWCLAELLKKSRRAGPCLLGPDWLAVLRVGEAGSERGSPVSRSVLKLQSPVKVSKFGFS